MQILVKMTFKVGSDIKGDRKRRKEQWAKDSSLVHLNV